MALDLYKLSPHTNECFIKCKKAIDELIDSRGLSDFSDKYYRSIGYPCFQKYDPDLKLLWVLIGGSLDESSNTVFRYLEPDSVESETYKLGSLTLGNCHAAGDTLLLKRYVESYSLLLNFAVYSIIGKPADELSKKRNQIAQFIQDEHELVFLGHYDSIAERFSLSLRDTQSPDSSSPGNTALSAGVLLGAAVLGMPGLAASYFEKKYSKPEEAILYSKDGDFTRLVFKTLFYEKIVDNIYQSEISLVKQIPLKVHPEDLKMGCTKSVSVSGRSFEVRIPPGSKNGTVLRMKGVGANGSDVLLAVSIENIDKKVDFKSNSSAVYADVSTPNTLEFLPSAAIIPPGRSDISDNVDSLLNSLRDQKNCIQSFFNDLVFLSESPGEISLLDGVLHIPPFDEALYASLAKEMHRYTLAELYDKRTEMSDKYSYVGAGIGAVIGLMTSNPLMPFAGGIYGRNFAPKGRRLEEILPDPHLLFAKDQSSFTAMTRSGSSPSRLRRLIFHKIVHPNGNSFFRIIPAIVSASAIIPTQIFRCSENAYFMRPVNAGIAKDAHPSNYSPIKLQKQYYHLLGDGKFSDTGERMSIIGDDIDGHRYRIYRHSCDTRELDYFYIDYATDPSHVF